MKAWELARLILPSISSRAPDKTHLPAPQEDHGIFFDRRRTPRFLWQGISSILDFTSIRKTRRHSRDGLASPVIMCECAMEPIGPVWPRTSRMGFDSTVQLRCPLLGSDTQAAAFPVSDPTSGRRTCKGWPTPAVAAKISRSSHLSSDGPGKGVGPATATCALWGLAPTTRRP